MSQTSELGAFLRARREQLSPADVGLRVRGRRRTPGLRREEVAALAGVSVDYLIRLEQGRDNNPSHSVIAALAETLRLSSDDRSHLLTLAAVAGHEHECPSTMAMPVRAGLRALLDRLGQTPAFVIDVGGDVLAWNETWAAVVRDMGLLDGEGPNLPRFVFLHPAAQEVFGDWATAADEEVARLRSAALVRRNDEQLQALLADLGELEEFAQRWKAHPIGEHRSGRRQLRHPSAGILTVDYELLEVGGSDQQLVTWLPADERTEAVVRQLAGTSGADGRARLRLVNER